MSRPSYKAAPKLQKFMVCYASGRTETIKRPMHLVPACIEQLDRLKASGTVTRYGKLPA